MKLVKNILLQTQEKTRKMARLPGEDGWLIQQIDGQVVVFQEGSEIEIVSFNPNDANAAAQAQFVIGHAAELTPEQRCFAHFWSGYFYAYATGFQEL